MTDYAARRKLLIDALRSGEYQQTSSRLRDETGFCCLGVACDIYLKQTKEGHWELDGDFAIQGSYYHEDLPGVVKDWFGLESSDGTFDDPVVITDDGYTSEHNALIGLNDDAGYTFEQIADFIETNPKGLWKEND